MKIEELEIVFSQYKDEKAAEKMKKYLRNQFDFIGIPKPQRAKLEKEFISVNKKLDVNEIINISQELHNKGYREYMYTAQQLLNASIKKLEIEHIYKMVELTKVNSWWENTDGYMMVVKNWLKLNPNYISIFINHYYKEENFWLRRIAIIAQLSLKEKVDFECLKKAINYSINDNEFFIQKAIGWSLRDYSKYNPEKVRVFIEENNNKLSKLAIREGSKYL